MYTVEGTQEDLIQGVFLVSYLREQEEEHQRRIRKIIESNTLV